MSHPEREGKGLAIQDHPPRFAQGDTARVKGLPTPESRWKVLCLNCESLLQGPFCSHCGQRAVPPHPTVREIAGGAFEELSGWDGKFAETFRLLLRQPGELTRRWIEGKRVAFIAPLRLYLTASLVYFAVSAAAPNLQRPNDGTVDLGAVKFGLTENGAPSRVSEQASQAVKSSQALTGAERDSALADIATAPALFRPMLRRAIDEPEAFRTSVQKAMPNVFLGLVPVLALILAIFYRRRHYPEHLFFAMHLATFIFVVQTLGRLTEFTRSIAAANTARALVVCWIVTYGVMALRRVYGGSIGTTILKGLATCVLYTLAATPVILGVALWAAS
jgi:hypothetical protein